MSARGKVQNAALVHGIQRLRQNQSWQLVFVALFTALLAFFVLVITLVEIESNRTERDYQRLLKAFHQEVVQTRDELGLPWLEVENTYAKGVRLSFNSSLFAEQSLFQSGRARLNPRFLPYLDQVVELIKHLDLPAFHQRYGRWSQSQVADEPDGSKMIVTLRVEGHTDAAPLAPTALYQDNRQLSTYRAYALMDWLALYTQLPSELFAIAGYGAFHPITQDPYDRKNRRTEVYLQPQVLTPASAGER
ncbi:MAG: OmpA family protein [Hydrogenovibrio sp.]|uniref:OmpA/MotB family protein n=1 Tax=Hydrogenovibrio sp. TaxID=2065821 RepID=UPI0028708941|nr:OmpA family protein [Hydrogenovibrio sp.]MDR9498864.1 OmpA family protein [Hydrogenovibrio sp.]